jgi:hypothetical protein
LGFSDQNSENWQEFPKLSSTWQFKKDEDPSFLSSNSNSDSGDCDGDSNGGGGCVGGNGNSDSNNDGNDSNNGGGPGEWLNK